MATSYMPPADRYRSILRRDASSANRYPSLERLDVARLKRLATNAPVSAFHLFDDDPRDLTHVLAFDVDHRVREPADNFLLLLG